MRTGRARTILAAAAALVLACLPSARLAGAEVHPLTLEESLRLAHAQSRSALAADEDLRLAESAFATSRADYGPQAGVRGAAGVGGTGTGRDARTDDQTASLRVSQELPTGGSLAAETTAGRSRAGGADAATTSGVAIDARQPLLRGAGPAVWRERLTAAERALADAHRRRELERQDLTVEVARSFWGLQQQAAALNQATTAVERAQFLLDQSRALMAVGKRKADDVFRAETNLLSARQQRVDAEAALANGLDRFRFRLALPPSVPMAIDPAPPALVRWRVDAGAAIATALDRRLDLVTARAQIGDAERAVALARDALWPRLDATGRAAWSGDLEGREPGGRPEWRVAVELDLPLTRQRESYALEQAHLALTRARRAYEESRERVINEVLAAVRSLRQAEDSLAIQDRNRVQAGRRVEKAELDFRAGDASNRDVVEAQAEVRAAEDALFSALVAYRIAELSLRRDAGVLAVGADGLWRDDATPYASPIEAKTAP